MAFISLLVMYILLWPLLLVGVLLSLLDIALPAIATFLLIWNLLVLAFLVWLRFRKGVKTALSRASIDLQTGWKRIAFLILRYGWVVLTLWVLLLVLACAAYLIWQPNLQELFFGLFSN